MARMMVRIATRAVTLDLVRASSDFQQIPAAERARAGQGTASPFPRLFALKMQANPIDVENVF